MGSLGDPDSSIVFEPLPHSDLNRLGIDMTQAYDFGAFTFDSVDEEGYDWGGALKGYCFRDDHGKDIISFGRQEVEAGVWQSFFECNFDTLH